MEGVVGRVEQRRHKEEIQKKERGEGWLKKGKKEGRKNLREEGVKEGRVEGWKETEKRRNEGENRCADKGDDRRNGEPERWK